MEPTKDPQLSRLLREWQVEVAPPALDDRVLGVSRCRWMLATASLARKTLRTAAIAGIVAFLIVVTLAIPQTVKLASPEVRPPYTVDSEYIRYDDDGSQAVAMLSKSYMNQNGAEVILERTIPDRLIGTAAGRTIDAILPLWWRLTRPVGVSKELEKARQSAALKSMGVVSGCDAACLLLEHWFFARAQAGAAAPCAVGPVVGNEIILGYRTIAVERPLPNPRATLSRPAASRITMWMAPDLGCFALKIFIEDQRLDGTFRPVSGKQALGVKLNP